MDALVPREARSISRNARAHHLLVGPRSVVHSSNCRTKPCVFRPSRSRKTSRQPSVVTLILMALLACSSVTAGNAHNRLKRLACICCCKDRVRLANYLERQLSPLSRARPCSCRCADWAAFRTGFAGWLSVPRISANCPEYV